MAGAKQTPRQKLIGLMYLVFLALMALNVSVEVLDSFPLINEGIEQTNKNFELKVDMVYRDFDQEKAISEEKVQPFYDQAQYIRSLADSLISFIMTQRNLMVAELNRITPAEADTVSLFDLKAKDNYSTSSRFWLKDNNQEPARDGGRGTRAYELRENILSFKHKVDSILQIHDLSEFAQLGLEVEGPFKRQDAEISWQQLMFDRVISVAVATNLSRLITEVRNAEFDVVNLLYGAITKDDFKFDRIEARVVPRSQIVLLDDYYEADIFVAAIDTRQTPQVFVGGQSIPTSDGVGRLRILASSEGTQTRSGIIRVTSPTGYPTEYPFTASFMVQKPTATVSATRMNLFYIGLDNPVSISAPGIPAENLQPEISSGSLTRLADGTYIARVQPGTSEVRITVNADMDGTLRTVGTSTFRVRTVPDPMAYVGSRREGRITRQQLLNEGGIVARMENFEFDLSYEIKSFTMLTNVRGFLQAYTSDSNRFSPEMVQAISTATRDQRIFFENITTHRGPDGLERTLPQISFIIQ